MHFVFKGGAQAEFINCIERFHITQRVHFAGVVRETKPPSLYRDCRCTPACRAISAGCTSGRTVSFV